MSKIGFIGLGLMGLPMARRLIAAGHEVVAWNRSPEPLRALAVEGAHSAANPAEVMERSALVGICVSSDVAVETIVNGDHGLLAARSLEGKAIADFSTGSPEAAQRFARLASARGAHWSDAPVSGGVPAAELGTLIVMAGGSDAAVQGLLPLFDAVASRISHLGPAGSGQVAKICNQMIVSCNLLVLAEAIALARKAGVEVENLPSAWAGGFADSLPLQIFGPRMAEHRFTPKLGTVAMMSKDVALARSLAEKFDALSPMLSLARELYSRDGLDADADVSSIISLYERAVA